MLRLFLKMLADDAHPTRVIDAAATARFQRPTQRSRAAGSRAGRSAVQAAGPGGGSEAGNEAASVSSRSASAAGMGSAPFCRVSRTTR